MTVLRWKLDFLLWLLMAEYVTFNMTLLNVAYRLSVDNEDQVIDLNPHCTTSLATDIEKLTAISFNI